MTDIGKKAEKTANLRRLQHEQVNEADEAMHTPKDGVAPAQKQAAPGPIPTKAKPGVGGAKKNPARGRA